MINTEFAKAVIEPNGFLKTKKDIRAVIIPNNAGSIRSINSDVPNTKLHR
jgi:hypothetical protein